MALPKDVDDDKPKPAPHTQQPHTRPAPQGPRIIIKKPEQPPTKEEAKSVVEALRETFRSVGKAARERLSKPKNHLALATILLFVAIGLTGATFTARVVGAGAPDSFTLCQSNVSVLASEKAALENALDSIKNTNTQLAAQVRDLSNTISAREATVSACQAELATSKATISTLQGDSASKDSNLTKLQSDVSALNSSLASAQSNFDALAQNYANRYCCQLNSLGFNYQAYAIVDNNVVCLTSGSKNITCS